MNEKILTSVAANALATGTGPLTLTTSFTKTAGYALMQATTRLAVLDDAVEPADNDGENDAADNYEDTSSNPADDGETTGESNDAQPGVPPDNVASSSGTAPVTSLGSIDSSSVDTLTQAGSSALRDNQGGPHDLLDDAAESRSGQPTNAEDIPQFVFSSLNESGAVNPPDEPDAIDPTKDRQAPDPAKVAVEIDPPEEPEEADPPEEPVVTRPGNPANEPTSFDLSMFDGLEGSGPGKFHTIDTPAELNGENGFKLVGDVADGIGYLGVAVSSGDFNGDGFSDIVVGAPHANGPAGNDIQRSDRGKTVVFFGSADGFASTSYVSDIDGTNGFSFRGSIDSGSGAAIANAGDFNGDGIDDLLIGGPSGNGRFVPESRAGVGYVLFGGAGQFPEQLIAEDLNGENGVELASVVWSTKLLGGAISSAGDLNGDGLNDVVIGASWSSVNGEEHTGQAFVVFGTDDDLDQRIELDNLDGTNGFRVVGSGRSANLGLDFTSPGDLNGDGLDDLIIGLGPRGASDEIQAIGGTMVVYGRSSGFPDVLEPRDLDGQNGFMIGSSKRDWENHSHTHAEALGDVNGDGNADFLVAYGSNAYVVYGGQSYRDAYLDVSSLTGDRGFKIEGSSTSFYPTNFAGGVDINADGFDDILLSNPHRYVDGVRLPGLVAVVFGSASGHQNGLRLDDLPGNAGVLIEGSNASDYFGSSISAAGDVNGDGITDIVVGAYGGALFVNDAYKYPSTFLGTRWNDFEGPVDNVGHTYVIFGQVPNEPVIRIGAAGDQTIRGGEFDDGLAGKGGDDKLFGGGGDDRLFGGTGDDVLIGGSGADILGGNEGTDTASYEDAIAGVVASLANPAANTGDAAGDSYIDIDNLTGTEFDDVLTGDFRANVIDGLGGDDTLTGRGGADTFIAAVGGGHDTVTDFNPGRDNIDLSDFGFASLNDALSHASSSGASTLFDFGGGDSLTLEHTNFAVLNSHNLVI